jgi:hypothetical protein
MAEQNDHDFEGSFEGAGPAFREGFQAADRRRFELMKERGQDTAPQDKVKQLILFHRSKGGKFQFYEQLAQELFGMRVDYIVWTESRTTYGLMKGITFCSGETVTGKPLFFALNADEVKQTHQHGGELEVSSYPSLSSYPIYVTGAEPTKVGPNRYSFVPRSFRYGTTVRQIQEP